MIPEDFPDRERFLDYMTNSDNEADMSISDIYGPNECSYIEQGWKAALEYKCVSVPPVVEHQDALTALFWKHLNLQV